MARKNIFGAEPPVAATPESASPLADIRPLSNLERPLKRSSPVGAFSQSLGHINEKAQRAADLERQLSQGQAVVELDPALIDGSFVPDRLGVEAADRDLLVEQIREHGQQVPVLVRPHPSEPGRYQVAYGHRRVAALRQLARPVRAVVRDLTDEQLVVSQGQENNARTDLSFIERSFFALRLEQRGFGRDVIMSALGVDKAALSRMIALAARLPAQVIEAIGAAPGFGRTRWAELADLLDMPAKKAAALKLLATPDFTAKSSDQRFEAIYETLRQTKAEPRVSHWGEGGVKAVRISETAEKLSLVFDKRLAPAFGEYVEQRLAELYADFKGR